MMETFVKWNADGTMSRVRQEVTPLGREEHVLSAILDVPETTYIVPFAAGAMRVGKESIQVAIKFTDLMLNTSFTPIKIGDSNVGLTPTYKKIQDMDSYDALSSFSFSIIKAFPDTLVYWVFVQDFEVDPDTRDMIPRGCYLVWLGGGKTYLPLISNLFDDGRCCMGSIEKPSLIDPIRYTKELLDKMQRAHSNNDLSTYARGARLTWSTGGVVEPIPGSLATQKLISNSTYGWVGGVL